MIQFIDLATQYEKLKNEINENINKVLIHGKYIMGPEVSELEFKLAEYVGVKHCISCSNGTDALVMPLRAWGISTGDAVFVPAFTFVATAEVVSLVGATPVFVDINPDTFNIDVRKLEVAITKVLAEGILRPKVIIPVDLFGLPAEHDKIKLLAQKYDLRVLEDAAQGFGGTYKNQKACSFGDLAATSFFPAKPLGCYGDGGAIFTDDDEMAAILKSIRVHGHGNDKYDNIRVGMNARIDTLQAAILLPKLKAFKDYELEERNRFAEIYTKGLKDFVKTPEISNGFTSSWAQYSILLKNSSERVSLQRLLSDADIPTMIYYNKPLHLQTVYLDLGYKIGDFPVSESICDQVLSLPMHPYLNEETIKLIINVIARGVK